MCGSEPEQRAADGRVEKVVSKFDAPKAQLFRLIIDGVLDRNLPWELVLIGVAIALMMELCGVPSLPFAVGAYLPLSTSTSIALGGFVRHLADRRAARGAAEAESSPGVLFASGLIAGGAIAGLLYAVLAGIESVEPGAGWGPAARIAAASPRARAVGALARTRRLGGARRERVVDARALPRARDRALRRRRAARDVGAARAARRLGRMSQACDSARLRAAPRIRAGC